MGPVYRRMACAGVMHLRGACGGAQHQQQTHGKESPHHINSNRATVYCHLMRRSARHNPSRLHKQEREAQVLAVQASPRLPWPEVVQPQRQRGYVRPSQRSCFLEICHLELSCRTDACIPTHPCRSHVRRKEYDAYIVGGTPRGGFAHPSQRRGTDQRPQSFVQLYDSERANVPGTRGPDSLLARPPAFQQDVHAPALRSAISGTQPGATGRWSLQQVRGAAIGRGRIRILDGGSSRARRRRPFARANLARRSPECCVLVFSPPEPPSQPAHSELSISPPLEC